LGFWGRVLLLIGLIPSLFSPILGCQQYSKENVLVTRVIDGDTVVIQNGARVRYIGIDTPEMPAEYLAREATEKNSELVEGKVVRLENDVRDKDDYGRLLRYVWVGDTMVNAELVRLGYAYSHDYPPDIKYQAMFDKLEDEAKENELGLWRTSE
jgi:micrococcal nuclease